MSFDENRTQNNPIYCAWKNMIQRCTNPKNPRYPRYGGRGIKVCDLWLADFMFFLEDVGPRPSSDSTLERIDNDGDYEPGNVEWVPRWEQALNRKARC